MSHPAIQPRLGRTNVETALRYMAAAIEQVETGEDDLDAIIAGRDYVDGFTAGVNQSMKIMRNMWLAAEIAAEATSQRIEDQLEDDDDDVP